MIAYIYTRTSPNDQRVHKSDRAHSQQLRCKDFLRHCHIKVDKTYSDQSEMHPVHFAPQFNRMLQQIRRDNNQHTMIYLIVDHIGRLGKDKPTQQRAIHAIKQTGAFLLWLQPQSSKNK